MGQSFLPTSDSGLLSWSANFDAILVAAAPGAYGVTAAQVTAYSALHTTYANNLALATDPSTKTRVTVADKNNARTDLKAQARLMAAIIQAHPGVTDGQKLALGLTVRDADPSPVPPPSEAPVIDILSTVGHTVSLRLHSTTSLRARPAGVLGASVLSHVGADAPSALSAWTFQANTGGSIVDVQFSADIAPGTKVWITAFWFNGRKESGPAAAPISIYLGAGLSQAA